jgi:hypothetical protein
MILTPFVSRPSLSGSQAAKTPRKDIFQFLILPNPEIENFCSLRERKSKPWIPRIKSAEDDRKEKVKKFER